MPNFRQGNTYTMRNMNINRLKSDIKDLHADLEKTGQADGELRELLQQLDSDLHRLLSTDDNATKDSPGFSERIESVAADFDARHPQIASTLREMADSLAKVGI